MDPLNVKNNVGGKKTDICGLKNMFKAIDLAIRIG